MMFAPLKRVATLTLAVSGVAVVLPNFGCDDVDASDKSVKTHVEKGASAIGDPNAAKTATDELKLAAGQSGASLTWQATAASSAGDLAYHNATTELVHLLDTEQQIRVQLGNLRALSNQVAITNFMASGQQKNDPAATLAKINQSIAEMKGDANKLTWGAGDTKTMPTLVAARQTISQLEGQITQVKEQIAATEKQRADAIANSETLMQQSQAQKGEESVKTFRIATAARKTAEDARLALDLQNLQLKRLEADLALAKGQEAAVQAGITRQEEQAKLLEETWNKVKGYTEKQRAIAKEIATGGEHVSVTVADTVRELTKLQQTAKTQRDAVGELLTEAKKQYEVAAGAAKKWATTGGAGTDPAAKAAREVVHPSRYTLKLGIVQREQGTVLASEARVAREAETTRAQLQTALQGAGLETPAELQSVELGVLDGMAGSAESMLSAAKETLESLGGGDTPKPLIRAIQTARLITLYRLIDVQDIKSKPGSTDELLQQGRQLREQMIADAFPVPSLPGELGVPAPLTPPAAPPAATPESGPGGFGTPAAPAAPAPTEPAAPAPTEPAAPAAPAEPAAPAAPAEPAAP